MARFTLVPSNFFVRRVFQLLGLILITLFAVVILKCVVLKVRTIHAKHSPHMVGSANKSTQLFNERYIQKESNLIYLYAFRLENPCDLHNTELQ